MRGDQLVVDAGDVLVAAQHVEHVALTRDLDASAGQVRSAAELVRRGLWRGANAVRRLEAIAAEREQASPGRDAPPAPVAPGGDIPGASGGAC